MRRAPFSLAALLLGCGARALPISIDHPLLGGAAPSFESASTDDREIAVPNRNPSNRATLIDFWASWCAECMRTMPEIESIWEDHRGDGLQVIGVSVDRAQESAVSASSALGATFPIVSDPEMRVGGAYRVRAIPISFVLDRRGMVRFVGRDPDTLRRAVDAVLAE